MYPSRIEFLLYFVFLDNSSLQTHKLGFKGNSFYLFIYSWVCWIFVAVQAFLQVWRAGAAPSLWCASFHCGGFLVAEQGLWSVWASGAASHGCSACCSAALEHRLNRHGTGHSCSAARGISPDQRLNLCLQHWRVILYH